MSYPLAFSTVYYAYAITRDNRETFVTGLSNTTITFKMCDGYQDDVDSWAMYTYLWAIGI